MTVEKIVSNPGRDVAFAIGILIILAVLFMPIPAAIIDIGLSVSISLSVLILMVALWIHKPLDFSSFPTILLIATMLRLSLNISTTRLILSNGQNGEAAAGGIIKGFANLVMGGDFIIGVIVFIILITVNFMVITKGASRIAEVGARFTLDSIPGKQMAIDADLAAGLLDEKEAQIRRKELEEESSFFGSMDGASKFVRGDAIAGLIITAVNIFGGIIIGVMRHGMSASEAADIYTRLSVGDGLVSQIPALIVSLAAGLLVSKGGTRGAAERAVLDQLGEHPKALMVTAGLMSVLALTPGLPFLPFFLLAIGLLFASQFIVRRRHEEDEVAEQAETSEKEKQIEELEDSVLNSLNLPEIELVFGKQLGSKMLAEKDGLGHRVSRMRKKFANNYGFVIPEIKISDDFLMDPKEYKINIYGVTLGKGSPSLTEIMVLANGNETPNLPYEDALEPVFGAKAWSFPDIYRHELKRQGYSTIDSTALILTHLSEVVRNNLSQLFSYKDMRQLINGLDKEYSRLVEEICPTHLSFSGLQSVFKLLLAERVSVRNVNSLLEAIAEVAPYTKRGEQIVEHVRTRISQQICGEILQDGVIKLLRLGPKWDDEFNNALKRDARGEISEFQMTPTALEEFGMQAKSKIKTLLDNHEVFAIATSPESRTYVRMVVERMFPTLPVLSNLELARGMPVKLLGQISE